MASLASGSRDQKQLFEMAGSRSRGLPLALPLALEGSRSRGRISRRISHRSIGLYGALLRSIESKCSSQHRSEQGGDAQAAQLRHRVRHRQDPRWAPRRASRPSLHGRSTRPHSFPSGVGLCRCEGRVLCVGWGLVHPRRMLQVDPVLVALLRLFPSADALANADPGAHPTRPATRGAHPWPAASVCLPARTRLHHRSPRSSCPPSSLARSALDASTSACIACDARVRCIACASLASAGASHPAAPLDTGHGDTVLILSSGAAGCGQYQNIASAGPRILRHHELPALALSRGAGSHRGLWRTARLSPVAHDRRGGGAH